MNLSRAQTIREPVGPGNGYWAGAPGAFYDSLEKTWYLTYRIRRPRGVEPDRGGEARIARSTDLAKWEDIWSVNKSAYQSASIERSAIHRGPDGIWRYFTSYVSPEDGRWCVSLLRGPDVRKLSADSVKPIFTAKPLKLEGIKDPWIFSQGNAYYMFLSIALPTPKTSAKSHDTLDIYNTGECVSATGLAVSPNLDDWEWKGVIFQPDGKGWDKYCRRINSLLPMNGNFIAFYDGSAGHEENYEEKTGIAISTDLHRWKTLTPNGPCLTSEHASRSLRYVDIQINDGRAFLFYEAARADGAHDLRLLTTDQKGIQGELDRLRAA